MAAAALPIIPCNASPLLLYYSPLYYLPLYYLGTLPGALVQGGQFSWGITWMASTCLSRARPGGDDMR